jgi:hypothetical protein
MTMKKNGHPNGPAAAASPRSTAVKKNAHVSAKKSANGAATDLYILEAVRKLRFNKSIS